MDHNFLYLAGLYGIETSYLDIWGNTHHADHYTIKSLLEAMDVKAGSWEECENSIREYQIKKVDRGIAPTLTYFEGLDHITALMAIPADDPWTQLSWQIVEETGKKHSGVFNREHLPVIEHFSVWDSPWQRFELYFPVELPLGYHDLTIEGWDKAPPKGQKSKIIIVPRVCYLTEGLKSGERYWGINAQLYSLKSTYSWGIGDFSDLKKLVDVTDKLEGSIVGTNPLHALDPRDVKGESPYFPSSRAALNSLNIDVGSIEEFSTSKEAEQLVKSESFQKKLKSLQKSDLIDYHGVLELKYSVLELLYKEFCEKHLNTPTERGRSYLQFVEERDDIRTFAVFEALHEHFEKQGLINGWGWRHWPDEYQCPSSAAVAEFAEKNADRIGFYQYLQWIADEQLKEVSEHADKLDLSIGLYMDLALNSRLGSAESWANQDVLAHDTTIGAPPDFYNPNGQKWNICAWNPHRLQETHFEGFIKVLREAMRYAGALRIDHVMSFMRLYWIPQESPPHQGAYVRYPLHDMVGIVALESQRNKCVIIGEDMGTVPKLITEMMDERVLLSYKAHLFCKAKKRPGYMHSSEFPRNALVVATVHDSPTLKGFWHAKDVHTKRAVGMINHEAAEAEFSTRAKEREEMVHGLWREGIHCPPEHIHGEFSYEINMGVHRLLARTPCMFQLVQLEDLLEQEEQVNLPGTYEECPNWRRKMEVRVEEELADRPVVKYIASAIREEGRK